MRDFLIIFGVVTLSMGWGVYTELSTNDNLQEISKVMEACEASLPRDQKCILEIRAVPEKKETTK